MKMNKKGFTLVELIVVIGILSLIFGIFSINFINQLKESKDIQVETVQNQIVEAAKAYVELHKNDTSDEFTNIRAVLYNGSSTPAYIPVSSLINDGLINTTVIDLNSLGNEYKSAYVKFYYDTSDGTLKFKYVTSMG